MFLYTVCTYVHVYLIIGGGTYQYYYDYESASLQYLQCAKSAQDMSCISNFYI